MPSGHTRTGNSWGRSGYENFNCCVCGKPWHAVPGSSTWDSQLCGGCWYPNSEWLEYVRTLEAVADYVDTLAPTELKEDAQ